MKPIKHTLLALSVITSLSACSFSPDTDTPEASVTKNKPVDSKVVENKSVQPNTITKIKAQQKANEDKHHEIVDNGSPLNPLSTNASFTTKYRHLLKENQLRKEQILQIEKQKSEAKKNQVQHENQDINFYVRLLMQDLVTNLKFVNSETPVAVTDFVMLDSDLNTTNLLGHQIAESLTHEIHKFGIPVIDYKATGYIRVTEDGDFFLTRNYEEISSDLPIQYIFTGVLTKHQEGYLVSAKVVDVQSKALVGTAQNFIPEHVSMALLPSQTTVVEAPKNETSLTKG